jgi:hypothetical protein
LSTSQALWKSTKGRPLTLWEQFLSHRGRLVNKWSHYFPVYESHFDRFRNRPCFLLEIGVSKGGSLQLWKGYLGPYARVVGLDIDESCRRFEELQVSVRIGDQKDHEFLERVIAEFGTPDIVIDDGSHIMSDIRSTFEFLYSRMSPTGVYIIEDLHTAYWESYEGGLGRPGTFIEVAKHLVDQLNADWTAGEIVPNEFTRSTLGISFYDSMVVFERGSSWPRASVMSGTRSKSQARWTRLRGGIRRRLPSRRLKS